MENIEDFIKNNLEDFNSEEPGAGHFEKFRKNLETGELHQMNKGRFRIVMRIAAVVLVLITVSVIIFDPAIHHWKDFSGHRNTTANLPADVRDAMNYYSNQAFRGITEINNLSGTNDEARKISAMAMKDIASLDANTQELTRAYNENPNDERITEALIQNQQMKDNIVKEIIGQLETVRK